MNRVAIGKTEARYCDAPPFHPSERYPEMPFEETSSQPNAPYALLRNLFVKLGYDSIRIGTAEWNPLGHVVKPGNKVVIKPNFVVSRHAGGGNLFSIVTHPSILRAVVDYTYIALKNSGRIIVADAPQMDCQWEQLMKAQRLDAVQEFYKSRFGFDLELFDLRNFSVIDPDQPAYSGNRVPMRGDPEGSVVVNLGCRSEFFGLPCANYYGADYNRRETIRRHHDDHHEYSVSKTVLFSDVVISVPKLKVHKKVGVTLNLKGLVGVNTDKNFLIHYRLGTPSSGGDQLPNGGSEADYGLIKVQRWLSDRLLAKQNRVGDAAYKAARLLPMPREKNAAGVGFYAHLGFGQLVRQRFGVANDRRPRKNSLFRGFPGNSSGYGSTEDALCGGWHCERGGGGSARAR